MSGCECECECDCECECERECVKISRPIRIVYRICVSLGIQMLDDALS